MNVHEAYMALIQIFMEERCNEEVLSILIESEANIYEQKRFRRWKQICRVSLFIVVLCYCIDNLVYFLLETSQLLH